jgi:subtilisin family serine protease
MKKYPVGSPLVRALLALLILLAISTPQATVVSLDNPAETPPEAVPGRVIVKLRDLTEPAQGLDTASIDVAVQILSHKEIESATELFLEPPAYPELARQAGLDQVYVLELEEGVDVFQVAEELAADPNVEYAEPDYILTTAVIPNDPSFTKQWGMNNTGQVILNGEAGKPDADIDMTEAWDITRGSPDIIIAVVDTGVDLAHPDLASKLVPGYNFTSPGSQPQDDSGHGTHVVGIVAAGTNNTVGVAGVCWECRIMPLKAMSNTSGSIDTVSNAIRYAVDKGAHVINLSLGGPSGSQTLLNAVRYAYLANVPIVAAMMNEAKTNPNTIYYPAAYPETIAVGSTDKMDLRSDFSSYGSHIDLSAPGSEILSTYWVSPNSHSYAYMWGTSMATPHVAGVIGLMRYLNPKLTVEEIRSILKVSAKDLGSPGWDIYYGSGRLNALIALEATIGKISNVYIRSNTSVFTINSPITFAAEIFTSFADSPITYSWVTSGQQQKIVTAGLTNTTTYTWNTPGTKTVQVSASNAISTKNSSYSILVVKAIYFPVISNNK